MKSQLEVANLFEHREIHMIPLCHSPSLYSSLVSSFFSLFSSNLHVHSPMMLFCFSSSIIPLCLSHMKTTVESMYRSSLSAPCVPILLLDHSPPIPMPDPPRWDGIRSRGNHRIQSNAAGHVLCTRLRAVSLTSRKPFVVTLHDAPFSPDKYWNPEVAIRVQNPPCRTSQSWGPSTSTGKLETLLILEALCPTENFNVMNV
jgi:hypothetical protein